MLVGDLVSMALFFGFDETRAVCAFAVGEESKSRQTVSAIKRFIIAKGISLRDIKRPSIAGATEGLRWGPFDPITVEVIFCSLSNHG